jgi:FkbM family methyltransferase
MIHIKRIAKQCFTLASLPILKAFVRNVPLLGLRRLAWRLGNSRLVSHIDFVTNTGRALMTGNTHDIIQRYLYWFGIWEPNITSFIVERMSGSPGRVFVDIGANIGYYSIVVGEQFPHASVVSIEAFPSILQKLRLNVKLNHLSNVRIIDAAVSDKTGYIDIYYSGKCNEGATTTVGGRFNSEPLRVPCKPLPELLTNKEISAARVIKIDVEGAEASVISGLAPILKHLPYDVEVIIEISGSSEQNSMIYDLFAKSGFYYYEIENNYHVQSYLVSQMPKRPQRLKSIPTRQADIVFSRICAEML